MLILALLTTFSFPNQLTNNVNAIQLNPPPGATVAIVNVDHQFYSNKLWETDNNLAAEAGFTMDLTLRCGWRLTNPFGLTFASTRDRTETSVAGMCVPYDNVFDGAGSSGDQDNDIVPTQKTVEIPLSLVPGNILLLKSDARSYADVSIFATSPTPSDDPFLDASLIWLFQTSSASTVTINYR